MDYSAVIIGLGRIAWLLENDSKREKPATHAGALSRLKGVRIVGGWDLDPQRRRDFSQLYKAKCDFDGPQSLLRELKPDLVVVATWPDSHLEMVDLAVEHGASVVICEKPLSMDLATARELAQLEGQGAGKTRILVNHERRYSKDYIWARDQIHQGQLGDLLSLRAVLYLGKTREPWKTLLHDGTHMIDVLRFLTEGEIKIDQAVGDPQKLGTTVLYSGAAGEYPLSLEIGSGRDHMLFVVELSFSEALIRVGNGICELWESRPARWAKGFRELKKSRSPRIGKTHYFLGMAQDALACLQDPDRLPVSRVGEGLATMQAVEDLLALSGLSLTSLQEDAQGHRVEE